MPMNNNPTSCTVILNGHGRYSKDYIINLTNCTYDITFLCAMKQLVSNAHHNLFLKSFTADINNAWGVLEAIPTTYKANNAIPLNDITPMLDKKTCLIYDHGLSNADEVIDIQTPIDIDNNRFGSAIMINTRQSWNNNTVEIQFDKIQCVNDIISAHQVNGYQYDINLHFSSANLVYIRPISHQGTKLELKFSDLLTDIIPKIKVPAVYHNQNQTVDILNHIFLDDNQYINNNINIHNVNIPCQALLCNVPNHSILCNTNEEVIRALFPQNFLAQDDEYHEVTISGDANIIWDSCREEML